MTALPLPTIRRHPVVPASDRRRSSSLKIVARDVGLLQVVIATVMLAPLVVSLIYGESYSALSFFVASLLTAGCGGLAYRACRDVGEPERSDAMLIAGAGWLVTALFGSLPFLLAAYWTPAGIAQSFVPAGETYSSSLIHLRNPLHAFFESMSTFTTTGLTMAVHEPSIGHGLLFYRSLGQWIGGAGVVVLSLAIIPYPSAVGGLELYQSESAGIKLRPRILETARTIWKVYFALTLLVAGYLLLATLLVLPEYGFAASLFDAVNHAMTGQSTGGFSTLDDSIAGYGSYVMDLVHVPPMVLGAISIPLYYTFLRKRELRVLWRDPQFRTMRVLLAGGIPALVALLWGTTAVADPIREGVFQVVSGLSTTGWQTSDIGNWESSSVLLLALGTMVVGGAAGATVGGVKLIRVFLLWQAARWRLRKVFLPDDAVIPFRVGERSLSERGFQREVTQAAVYCFLYVLLLTLSVIVVAAQAGPDFSLADVIFECVSAQGTVGLSSGITDPGMPRTIELVFILQMWLGRLEIFPVVVLLGTLASRTRRRT